METIKSIAVYTLLALVFTFLVAWTLVVNHQVCVVEQSQTYACK